MRKENLRVGIIGLGHVGFNLFEVINKSHKYVYGYDISRKKISELHKFNKKFKKKISYNQNILKNCNFFIVCVPTPVFSNKKPDLSYLVKACKNLSKILKKNDYVVFESTVFPGVTKKVCIPNLINKYENKKFFFVGYAPERYSPGENKKINHINKIVSGENKIVANKIKMFYSKFIKNVYVSKSIEEAEMIKNFENCQRDHNIALVNELSILCDKSNLDVNSVLKGCLTKWNFNDYKPGLVGGHCISVDPYYLINFSKSKNFTYSSLENSRKINNNFVNYTKKKILRFFKRKKLKYKKKLLYVGITYKKNVRDVRNSGAQKIFNELKKKYYNLDLLDTKLKKKNKHELNKYEAFILLVLHDEIKKSNKIMKYLKNSKKCFDVFSLLN